MTTMTYVIVGISILLVIIAMVWVYRMQREDDEENRDTRAAESQKEDR